MTRLLQPAPQHRSFAVAAMPIDRTKPTGSIASRSNSKMGGGPRSPHFFQGYLVVNELIRGLHYFWFVMLIGIVPATAQVDPSLLAPMAKPSFRSLALIATGKPVARVNGTVLTDRDLLREMLTIFPYARQHGGKFPEA